MTRSSLLIACLLTGCTYAPPVVQVSIANHVFSPDLTQVAFAVHAIRLREATGLSAFPDGGVPLVLNEGAAVYTCDTATLRVERLWQMDRPAELRSGFGPWMGPWTGEGVYLAVSGYAGSTSDPARFRRQDFLLHTDRTVVSGVVQPARGPATSEPPRCARAVRTAAEADPPYSPEKYR